MCDLSRSILIAVEGIDGAGKTTQVGKLEEALRTAGQAPIVSKEPTNGSWGQKIRDSAANGRLSPQEEFEAFFHDRTEHVEKVIQPALEAGKIVILDRYFYSTIAYQGSRGLDPTQLKAEMEKRFPIPDAVFVLDIDPTLAVYRISQSRKQTPNEFERIEELVRVRAVFGSLEGHPVTKIDGSMSVQAVHRAIMNAFVWGALKSKRCAKEYGCDDPFHCTFALTGTCEWWNLSRSLFHTLHEPVEP